MFLWGREWIKLAKSEKYSPNCHEQHNIVLNNDKSSSICTVPKKQFLVAVKHPYRAKIKVKPPINTLQRKTFARCDNLECQLCTFQFLVSLSYIFSLVIINIVYLTMPCIQFLLALSHYKGLIYCNMILGCRKVVKWKN